MREGWLQGTEGEVDGGVEGGQDAMVGKDIG